MSAQTIALPLTREQLRAAAEARGEPAWLVDLRLRGLEAAETSAMPKIEKVPVERWTLDRYGSHRPPQPWPSLADLPERCRLLLPEEGQSAGLLIQRNSGVVHLRLDPRWAEQGVIFTSLENAAREHEALVRPYLASLYPPDEHRIAALHTALWSGGAFLYVPAGVRVDVPVQAMFVADDAETVFAPHVLIVAGEDSFVTYVENVVSDGLAAELTVNAAFEVVAARGAYVRVASVHNLEAAATGFNYRRAVLDRDARIEWLLGELNNGNAVADTTTVMRGHGSSSDAKTISVGTGSQRMSLTTRAIHVGRSTPSDMVSRVVLRDEAFAVVNGVTKIEKGATGANGEQTEKVLMLSPKARGDANPILLIDEDDVRAEHAASVGPVNPEHVYYLMSRGITREEAEKLIISGFLAPIVEEVPLENVRKQLELLVERKLGR